MQCSWQFSFVLKSTLSDVTATLAFFGLVFARISFSILLPTNIITLEGDYLQTAHGWVMFLSILPVSYLTVQPTYI